MFNIKSKKVKVSAFGLNEAAVLLQRVGDDKSAIQVAVGVISSLGIPNVMKEQGEKLINAARATINSVRAEIARIQAKDSDDAAATKEKVDNLVAARKVRADKNTADVKANDGAVTADEALIQQIQELVNKFS